MPASKKFKKTQRKPIGRRPGRRVDAPAQADLLHTLGRVCDQLERVVATFERIGGLVERHLQASTLQTKQAAPTAKRIGFFPACSRAEA